MTDHQFSAEWCTAAAQRIAELEKQLASAQEAAYAGWVGATGYPIAEWVYLYHPWLREYKPKATLKKGLPILGTVSDDGAVIWNGGDGP